MPTAIKTASVLAFERKLDPSDALLFSGSWKNVDNNSNDWKWISVREKSVRGTISNRRKAGKDQDPAKIDADIRNPNLQTVDISTLPPDADTLKVWFSLKILPGVGIPSACNQSDYQAKLIRTVNGYIDKHGLGEIARRYACNIANARFLWRNRLGAERIKVFVRQVENNAFKHSWTFEALDLSLRNFSSNDKHDSSLKALTDVIVNGLSGKEFVLLEVTAYAQVGAGQEVFPSQELILDKSKLDKSRTLYEVDKKAAIHSQKIGNALRTIDTWHAGAEEVGPIAIEPYGSVTSLGKAFRQPRDKKDFYTLLDRWLIDDQEPSVEDQHYIVAMFIRGGVFGEKE